jgi:hypothetical protein
MGKLKTTRSVTRSKVKRSVPKVRKRKLPDVRKYAGLVPGMADWAIAEVRRMRDEQ